MLPPGGRRPHDDVLQTGFHKPFGITSQPGHPPPHSRVSRQPLKDKDGNDGFYPPVGLITQHQLWQGRAGGVFNLRGGELKYIEVARLDERDQNSEIELQYETVTQKNQEGQMLYANRIRRELAPYTLKIAVYGAGAPPFKIFSLSVQGGQLTMTELEDAVG
jgi:hypothetical protein